MLVTIVKSDPRAREKPCLRCGLSLRKLLDAKHCPRCGLSVWLSLNDNQSLDWSKPAWLKTLALGTWIMAPAQLLGLAAFAVAMVPVSSPAHRYPTSALLCGLYLMIYHAGLLVACFHEQRYPDRLRAYRLANRIVADIAIAFGLALLLRGITYLHGGWPMPLRVVASTTQPHQPTAEEIQSAVGAMLTGSLWTFAVEVVLAISALATFAYYRKLAQRVPNSTVARLCGYILLAPLVSFLKVFPFFGAYLVLSLLWLTEYLPAIYFPGTAVLLGWLALAFGRATPHATEAWAKETVLPDPRQGTASAT